VVTGFLGNRRADNYKDLVEELLSSYQKLGCNMSVKIHFLSSHLDFFPENCSSVSNEHGERLHQDIAAMEGGYKGKWSPYIVADYCWTLMHDSPNLTFNQQTKKAQLHYSYLLKIKRQPENTLLHLFTHPFKRNFCLTWLYYTTTHRNAGEFSVQEQRNILQGNAGLFCAWKEQ